MNPVKLSIGQMRVKPASPMHNAESMVSEINEAVRRGQELIVFPEMAIPGYLLGDRFEFEDFLRQIELANQKVIEASKAGIVVIFGSIYIDRAKKGEDGRVRKLNTAFVAKDGKLVQKVVKTLHPNYRYFFDDRQFFSLRKVAEEIALESGRPLVDVLRELIVPVRVRVGSQEVSIGLHQCEDMWHGDYNISPAHFLYEQGVDFFVNLSASPWGWQKNRKRHQVVRELLADCPAPYVYVNFVGVDQIGKSIITYEGASTVYDASGRIVYNAPRHKEGVYDFLLSGQMREVHQEEPSDTEQLYWAVFNAMKACLGNKKVVIGLSGGIDSAVSFAMAVLVRGAENVIPINMPYDYNSPKLQDFARDIARNFGTEYLVQPIAEMAEPFLKIRSVQKEGVAYENVLARARGNILCTYAQTYDNALVLCNGNKVEYAFNYGTLYGDILGAYAFLADLAKREVRQLAEFINHIYGREMIPQEVIDQKPSAELKTGQFDPFDYGDLKERGYHDELVRAFTEFRATPAWVLEHFANGTLEEVMKLTPGRLAKWFSNGNGGVDKRAFVSDLERWWAQFQAPFKRNQSPYILVVSRKAFGHDLVESMFPMEETARYSELKSALLG